MEYLFLPVLEELVLDPLKMVFIKGKKKDYTFYHFQEVLVCGLKTLLGVSRGFNDTQVV